MQFDLIIIGGGMVGASLACALQKKPISIALIDSAPIDSAEDERLIALNDNSVCFFENLNIWSIMAPHAASIQQIHVSQRGRFGITRIHANEVQLSALGYVVPAKYINAALNHALKSSQIQVLRSASLQALTQADNQVTLTIATESGIKTMQASRVIGADGTHSTVRQLLNIPTEKIDYQQSALVTITELQRDHHQIAYERFQNSGAIAMLPLTDKKVATIWTDSREYIAELMKLNDSEFLSTLQKQFGYRLGRFLQTGKRAFYPLHMVLAKEHRQQNVMLIGNALHTLHPIAAQGLNLALFEVAGLAENLAWDDFKPQTFNVQLSHRLSWLFSSDMFLLNTARQLGLISLDIFSSVKKRFAKHAMGKTGKVPYLLIRDNG